MNFDVKTFKNPTKEYRAKPFWSLNGKLEKKELKKQIDNMKMMGFGGAFLHSRTGLKTEYMSEEWLDLMKYCVEVLKSNEMDAFLYDEDRWPSGSCGGYVTMHREYRAKSMRYIELKNPLKDALPENILGIFAVTFGSQNKCLSYRKIENVTEAKKGEKIYCFIWVEMLPDTFYNGYTYIDTLYKPACEKFIELTHEKYKSVMGDKFGKEIVGIFTDEPNRGPIFTGFGRESEPYREELIPYTPALFSEFLKRKGYNLEDYLPLLWFGKESDPFVKEMYDYLEVVNQLFLENFAKPYHDWCVKNKLIFTGHILHEDNLVAQTTLSGSMMRFYEYMDYPGIDNLGSCGYFYNVPAMLSSTAKQLGKEFTLDELYGISGWSMNLKDYKRIGDWQSAGGVTFRCPHLSWYTMAGEAKRDCPASLFHQSAWYTEYHVIEDYFSRLSYIFAKGEDTVSTAIIHPIESTWGLSNWQTYDGVFSVKEPIYAKIEKEYAELYKDIILNAQSADYIDEGLLLKYGSVDGKNLICGKKAYDKVIVNGNYNLRSSTLEKLTKYMKNGGKVLVVGDMPCYLDGVKHDFTNDFALAEKIPFDTEKVIEKIKDKDIIVNGKNIISTVKKFNSDTVAYFLNQSENPNDVEIKIRTDKKVSVLNAREGTIESVDYFNDGEFAVIKKHLEYFEEIILICSDETYCENDIKPTFNKIETFDTFKYELEEGNMLVLDNPTLYIDGVKECKKSVIFVDQEVRKKFGLQIRHNQMIQPWFKEKFFPSQDKLYARVTLEYDFNVDEKPSYLEYMYEDREGFVLKVNGKIVSTEDKRETVIDNCFSVVDIPIDLIVKGENKISTTFDFYEKTDIEGSFLIGDFGVKIGFPDTLIKLPKTLNTSDLCEQGLPYYGGRIKLTKPLDNGTYLLKTSSLNVATLTVNGRIVAFAPFNTEFIVNDGKLTIEAVLNRNNCFGVMVIDGERKGLVTQNFDKFDIYKKL